MRRKQEKGEIKKRTEEERRWEGNTENRLKGGIVKKINTEPWCTFLRMIRLAWTRCHQSHHVQPLVITVACSTTRSESTADSNFFPCSPLGFHLSPLLKMFTPQTHTCTHIQTWARTHARTYIRKFHEFQKIISWRNNFKVHPSRQALPLGLNSISIFCPTAKKNQQINHN